VKTQHEGSPAATDHLPLTSPRQGRSPKLDLEEARELSALVAFRDRARARRYAVRLVILAIILILEERFLNRLYPSCVVNYLGWIVSTSSS